MSELDCWRTAYRFILNGESERAIAVCEKEPCSNQLECQRFLGWTYYQRDQFETALTWFAKAAEQGDGDALYGMGSVHFVGRNFQLALQYYERAAALGYARACHWIGYIHHQGLGVPRNVELAIDCYKQGAARGYLVAERALIHLTWQRGNVLQKLLVLPRYLTVIAKAAVIAARNINDPRIVDVPNAFDKRKD